MSPTKKTRPSSVNPMSKQLSPLLLATAITACIAPPASTPGAGSATAPSNAKSCGPDGIIDDAEDGNNQVSDVGGRGGYWYTFLDKAGSSVSPKIEAQGGKFAMSPKGANGSELAANAKGKVATA